MKFGYACHFRFDRIISGAVRDGCSGKRNSDIDVVGGQGLVIAWLATGKFGSRTDFGASAACIPSRNNKFARNVSDRHVGQGRRFFFAARSEK
jgi:hypothetical protein